jgi:hypothetical protein
MAKLRLAIALLLLISSLASAQTTRPFGTPGIELKPFTFNPRLLGGSLIDLTFLHDAPAGRTGFIRTHGADLVRGDGSPIRFWGFDLTEWSPGSMEIPPKADAPIYAEALCRLGVNLVRLHFLDLPAPRGMIDGTRNDSQHFNLAQLDNEDFFISELLKRGIYIDMNLNVGRQFARGDGVLTARVGKGPLLFDKRLIELEKDYARQLLTHVNPYTHRAYVAEPGMALVEIVNEDAIYPGWTSNSGYNQELTDLYNAWLKTHLPPDELSALRRAVGVGADQPIPRLTGRQVRLAPRGQYDAECEFMTATEGGFFREMNAYLRHDLGVQCPILATSDHSHSGSSYPLLMDTSQLDVMDGHDYWQHPSENPRNTPMVNEPLNSTVIDLSRTAMLNKPYTVSEMNHPFPNQFACEGIPILAAYAGFQSWDAVVWYTFEMKRDPNWRPYIGDPFDMSLDPIKMPQIAAGALMFERGDLDPARQIVTRSYTVEQAYDSRRLSGNNRPYFTPGFPLSVPLLHGSRISSLDGPPTSPVAAALTGPFQSDTGQLDWFSGPRGLVTIDSPRSQGLVGFVKAGAQSTTNLSADVRNNFCAILLNSLNDKPIATSDRLLMTTAARVENTGMTWAASYIRINRRGSSPTLIEPVTGTITLHDLTAAQRVTVTPLDGTGQAIGLPIMAESSAGGWRIPVGEPVTTWYLIAIDR